jgi:hypothetical protein
MRRKNSEQKVLRGVMPMMKQPQSDEDQGSDESLLLEYEHFLSNKAEGTIDAYVRTTRQVMEWIAQRPGNGGHFHPRQSTKTAVEVYLQGFAPLPLSVHLKQEDKIKPSHPGYASY